MINDEHAKKLKPKVIKVIRKRKYQGNLESESE